jgi:copper chaperone
VPLWRGGFFVAGTSGAASSWARQIPLLVTRTETLRIEGMSCDHCVRAVHEALQGVPGVTVEHVGMGQAEVRYDDGEVTRVQLTTAVEGAGYTVAA